MEQPRASQTETLLLIAGATLAVALLGVGMASKEVVRHVIQAAPLLLFCVAGARQPTLLRWLLVPIFLFWLLICILIWLFLLHLSTLITGTFSRAEITLTLVMGAASVVGIGLAGGIRRPLPLVRAIGLPVLAMALQVGAFAVSIKPWVAHADGHEVSQAAPRPGVAHELA